MVTDDRVASNHGCTTDLNTWPDPGAAEYAGKLADPNISLDINPLPNPSAIIHLGILMDKRETGTPRQGRRLHQTKVRGRGRL